MGVGVVVCGDVWWCMGVGQFVCGVLCVGVCGIRTLKEGGRSED